MFRLKKILFGACVTLLLTFVLAVPGFALVSVDNVGYGYISLNGSKPVYSTGSFPRGVYDNSIHLSSYTIYLPFDEVAEKFSTSLSFLSRAVASYGTYSCSYGTLRGEKYTKVGDLPSPSLSWAPQTDFEYQGTKYYNIGRFVDIDTSSVKSIPRNCFVRIQVDGCDFTIYTNIPVQVGSIGAVTDTVYWDTPLGFYITAGGMTSFSSTGTSGGSNLVKPISQTNGYIGTQSYSASKVKVKSSVRASNSFISAMSFSGTRSSDDREAVEQLKQVNTTLDGMAANLQTITDDFTAREDIGNNISGVTTDDQIANGNAGLTTGSSSISQAISGLPSFSSVVAPATGFISFLTSPVQDIFSFANGYLLYIAAAIVLLSVIFWVIKRMGGDS
jgi:hypothetical protein